MSSEYLARAPSGGSPGEAAPAALAEHAPPRAPNETTRAAGAHLRVDVLDGDLEAVERASLRVGSD